MNSQTLKFSRHAKLALAAAVAGVALTAAPAMAEHDAPVLSMGGNPASGSLSWPVRVVGVPIGSFGLCTISPVDGSNACVDSAMLPPFIGRDGKLILTISGGSTSPRGQLWEHCGGGLLGPERPGRVLHVTRTPAGALASLYFDPDPTYVDGQLVDMPPEQVAEQSVGGGNERTTEARVCSDELS